MKVYDWEVYDEGRRYRYHAEMYWGTDPTLLAAVYANSRFMLQLRMLAAQFRYVWNNEKGASRG